MAPSHPGSPSPASESALRPTYRRRRVPTASRASSAAGGYPPAALLALLAVGTLLRRYVGLNALSEAGEGLPGWLGAIGRRPLTWYVAHLLLLQGLVVMVS